MFFDGILSHTVIKTARPGDFRVQSDWGGAVAPCVPEPAAVEAATRILAAIGETLLYARIDLVLDEAGRWVLLEAELIEPELFLSQDPCGGAAFVDAVAARLVMDGRIPVA